MKNNNSTPPKATGPKRAGEPLSGKQSVVLTKSNISLTILLLTGPPKKKMKNGIASVTPQPKNTVAMLNELRQGLIYTLEGQAGPVHAPIFTMSVEVCAIKYSF